jgi:hypothetical protein
MTIDLTPIGDESYDCFAVFDSVPAIVRSIDKTESRFLSLLCAFIGVGSAFVGPNRDDPMR